MKVRNYFLPLVTTVLLMLFVVSCGKSDEQTGKDEVAESAGQDKSAKSDGKLQELAREARGTATIDDEFLEGKETVEAAGFVVRSYGGFPSQEVAKKGRMLVYTDKRAKKSGGVVYVKKVGAEVSPSWHWYFKDMVPDSVVKDEINNDGLWDVRIVMTNGKVLEFTQEESFTLFGKERTDWIAMNGRSSAPVSDDTGMWKCFDGDTVTAWKSSTAESENYLEFDVPFGVEEGILSIYTLPEDQPKKCTVMADGKKIKQFELKPVAGLQMTSLGGKAKGAKRVRLVFNSNHGNGGTVSVAELSLK